MFYPPQKKNNIIQYSKQATSANPLPHSILVPYDPVLVGHPRSSNFWSTPEQRRSLAGTCTSPSHHHFDRRFFCHPQMVGFWHWVAHIIFDRDIYNQGTCWHVGLPPRFHHLWWLIYPHSPHFIVISHIFQYIMLFHCARWHAYYRLLSFINAL